MLSSVSGQNQRVEQLAAADQSTAANVSQTAASVSSASAMTAVTGVTGSPMSTGMQSALMAFISRSAATGSASQTSTSASQSIDGPTSQQAVLSNSAQLLNDLQSLISVLGGGAPTTAGTPAQGAPAASNATDSVAAADYFSNFTTTAATGAPAADQQPVTADPGPAAQPSAADDLQFGPPPPPAPQDITNQGTVAASSDSTISNTATVAADTTGRGNPISHDPLTAFMQQFAMAAYSSGYASGMESAATSSRTTVNA